MMRVLYDVALVVFYVAGTCVLCAAIHLAIEKFDDWLSS